MCPRAGLNFAMLSTGLAVDKTDKGFVEPQDPAPSSATTIPTRSP